MVTHSMAAAQHYPAKPVRIVVGMLVPAKTPPAVVARLGELSVKALADAQLKERLLAQGIEAAAGGVEEFGRYLNVEIAKWAKVSKAAAIPPQ